MKCKYKKFLKAAYIDYSEDYCGNGSSTFTKPTITTPVIVITGNTAIIACAISGVTIYYTLDGSTPTSSSTEYTGTITLTYSCTIKAIAVKPGMTDSEVASENYIHYLTAWRLVGNSTVHTDEYLTQWKVEGNSVVDNNAILSCGDLGQDGYYHVKISNGVDVFDIALDEPLRKVNDIADTIEFADGVATLTRNFDSIIVSNLTFSQTKTSTANVYRYQAELGRSNFIAPPNANTPFVGLCALYDVIRGTDTFSGSKNGIASTSATTQNTLLYIYDSNYNGSDDLAAFVQHISGMELIYQCTPTTEVIQAPQISVSPTNTYSSANDTPYSAFEYKKNVEIWSCGEYNAIDGKYHILVQPLGGSIADITLDEPLRKVNDVADTIEFADGVALVTRNLKEVGMATFSWRRATSGVSGTYRFMTEVKDAYSYLATEFLKTINTGGYENTRGNDSYYHSSENRIIGMYGVSENSIYPSFVIYDPNYNQADDLSAFLTYISDKRIIYRLATPTTETIQVPQIQEAESYSCIISPDGKAVSWSEFLYTLNYLLTDSENNLLVDNENYQLTIQS